MRKDEIVVYNQIADSAARQISESRSFFEKMYKATLGGVILVGTIGIGVFYWLVASKYAEIEATIEKKTDQQLVALQEKVRSRVEEEFKTEKMKELIRSVAQDQTKKGLSDVITRAVGDQVLAAIKAEGPKIQQAVIQETKKSVSDLAPSIIDKAVKEKTSEAESRIQSKLAESKEVIRAGNLAIVARNGSGTAYDELMTLMRITQDPQVKEIGTTTRYSILAELNSNSIYMARSFREAPAEQELLKLLDDPSPENRQAAIDVLVGQGKKFIVPKLLEKAEHDPAIIVRHAAFRGLQILTAKQFDAVIEQWQAWWKENKGSWPPKN